MRKKSSIAVNSAYIPSSSATSTTMTTTNDNLPAAHNMQGQRALHALHALLPGIERAQRDFNQAGGAPQAADRFNAVLEPAFRALCLDLKSIGQKLAVHDEASLASLMAPRDDRSLWFRLQDPSQTARRLTDLASTGDWAGFLKKWPGPSAQDSAQDLPAGIERTCDDRWFARLEKSLRSGSVVGLGEVQVRYARRGQEWEEEGNTLQALDHGVYLRLPAKDREDKTVGHRWLHHGTMEDLPRIVEPHVQRLSGLQREQVMQSMVFQAAMRTIMKAEQSLAPKSTAPAA